MTLKDYIKKYNGQEFNREVIKGQTIDQIPEIEAKLKQQAAATGLEVRRKGDMWEVYHRATRTGQIILVPKVHRYARGVLQFKSNHTEFGDSRGDLPKASELEGDSFVKDYGDVAYRYTPRRVK